MIDLTRERVYRNRLIALLLLVFIGSCETTDTLERSHNAAGGYIEACGPTLPGVLGDDC